MPDYITDQRLAARLDTLRGESDLPSMHPPIKRYDPTSGMTGMDKFLAGAGRSVVETGRGLGQLAGVVSQADIDAARRLDVPLMATGAGQAGNIAGSVAQMYGPGVMVKGAAALPGLTRLAPVAESLLNPATAAQAGLLGGMFSCGTANRHG